MSSIYPDNNGYHIPKNAAHCRLCAQEKKSDDLLDWSSDEVTLELNNEDILEMYTILEFFKIDFIDLLDWKLPKTSCVDCYSKMLDCYNFFQTVKQSQNILYGIYYSLKEEKEDDEISTSVHLDSAIPKTEEDAISIVSNISYQEEFTGISNKDEECEQNISTETENLHNDDDMSILVDNRTSNFLGNPKCFGKNTSTTNHLFSEPNLDTEIKSTDWTNNKDSEGSLNFNSKSNQNCSLNTNTTQDIPATSDIENKETDLTSKIQVRHTDSTWDTYLWSCKHCGVECDSMDDLRAHGMQLHKRCHAFKCVDCSECVNTTFSCFIEHARQHRNELRYICPHCNVNFETISCCSDHVLTHWSDGQQICQWCGKICPDANALKLHRSMTRRDPIPNKLYKISLNHPRVVTPYRMCGKVRVFDDCPELGTWDDYDWTCQICPLHFSSADLLRTHTQELHGLCFAMKCADCPIEYETYKALTRHVAGHRPLLKEYCPYCNRRISDVEDLKKHVDDHFTASQKPCDECGQTFENKQLESQHFKLFKPMRLSRYLTAKDLTCEVCNKVFKTHVRLSSHMKTHDKTRKMEHICHICGKECYSESLSEHLATHGSKSFICKVCDLRFSKATGLKYHVKIHLKSNKFVCDHCSKEYNFKPNLIRHLIKEHGHSIDGAKKVSKKYKCQVCGKIYYASISLKNHIMSIHKGERPYKCQNCEKTFTNWANCNKHMKRIHKTTLVKTKMTAYGRIPINVKEVDIQSNKQWLEDVLRRKRPGKRVLNTPISSIVPDTRTSSVVLDTPISSLVPDTPISSVVPHTPISSVVSDKPTSSVALDTPISSLVPDTPISSVVPRTGHAHK